MGSNDSLDNPYERVISLSSKFVFRNRFPVMRYCVLVWHYCVPVWCYCVPVWRYCVPVWRYCVPVWPYCVPVWRYCVLKLDREKKLNLSLFSLCLAEQS